MEALEIIKEDKYLLKSGEQVVGEVPLTAGLIANLFAQSPLMYEWILKRLNNLRQTMQKEDQQEYYELFKIERAINGKE